MQQDDEPVQISIDGDVITYTVTVREPTFRASQTQAWADNWLLQLVEQTRAVRESFRELDYVVPQRARKSGLSSAFETAHVHSGAWSLDETTAWAERTQWEQRLDAVRADHDEQQHRRLWSERDLDVVTH